MGPNAAQLTAAVSALINALVASKFSKQSAMGLMNTISYARWGLEGYVIAEANCLKGERCPMLTDDTRWDTCILPAFEAEGSTCILQEYCIVLRYDSCTWSS